MLHNISLTVIDLSMTVGIPTGPLSIPSRFEERFVENQLRSSPKHLSESFRSGHSSRLTRLEGRA